MNRQKKAGGTDYFVEVFASNDRLNQCQSAGQASLIVVHTEDGQGPLMLDLHEAVQAARAKKGGFTKHEGGPGVVGPVSFTTLELTTEQIKQRVLQSGGEPVMVATQRPRPERFLTQEDLDDSRRAVDEASNNVGITQSKGPAPTFYIPISKP